MIVLQGARGRVEVVEFSPDGRTLVAPSRGGVQLWNHLTDSGRPASILDYGHGWSVRFTPDGRKLVLGGSRRLVLHDLPTGEAIEIPLEIPGGVDWDLSPDGRSLVAVVSCSGRLSCWSVADPTTPVWSVYTPRQVYSPPLFLAGGGRFVVFERERWMMVTRDARTGEVVAEVPVAGGHFHSPVMSPDRRLIAGLVENWLVVFQVDDLGAEPVKLRNDNRKWFTGIAFHPSGRYLAATTDDATVQLYDTATWAVAEAYSWGIGRLRSVGFSPDGMVAAAGGDSGKVVVWDVDL